MSVKYPLFLILLGASCTGTVTYTGGGPDGAVSDDRDAAADAHASSDSPVSADAAPGAPDSSVEVDAAMGGPLQFNIILRQTIQDCGGCGIWFDWQGVDANKPRLVIEYQYLGESHTAEYQHGLGGMDNAHSIFLSSSNDGDKHSILVKQSPQRTGLVRVDISDIPEAATIVSATLHLHINTAEGLSYDDFTSVLEVHACDKQWNWDQVTWTQYASGLSWSSSGGDFGSFIRQIRAKEDLRDRGFSKANPHANFDFTAHVQQLQAAR